MRTAAAVAAFSVCVCLAFEAQAQNSQNCPSRGVWPKDDWETALIDETAKANELKALDEALFTLVGKDSDRKGFRTDTLVVVKGGKLVYERYARGWDATKRHYSWSVAKGISGVLTGIAVKQGLLSLDDSICKYLTEYSGPVCDITVRNVITMSPGLQWQEEYEKKTYQVSSVISMLFGVGHRDQVRFVLGHQRLRPPGERYVYSTGTAHVLATVVKRAMAKAHGADAFWSQLFERIGMKRVVMEEDVAGNALGGSFVYATTRDFARLGYLYLNDGCWEGERLVPEGWVAESTSLTEQFRAARVACKETSSDPSVYTIACPETPNGYLWYSNRPAEPGLSKPWKDAPDDSFAAVGHWGQRVIFIPSMDTVIARFGDDRDGSIPTNTIIKAVLPLVQ